MLSFREIFVLNSVIDGYDINGLPSFEDLRSADDVDEMIEESKEKLITKGVLETKNTLTPLGVEVLVHLEKYKKATKYVRIQNLCIGVVDDDKGVLLKQIASDAYELKYVKFSSMLDILSQKFPFINEIDKYENDIELSKKVLSRQEAFKAYFIDAERGFKLETFNNVKGEKTAHLFYVKGSRGYQYDLHTHVEQSVTFKKMKKNIKLLVN